MSIKFSCPHCQKALQVKEDLAGKKVKCPGCQQVLDVPAAVAAGVSAAPKASEPPRPVSVPPRAPVASPPPPRPATPAAPASQIPTKAAQDTLKPASADAIAKAPPKPVAPAAPPKPASPVASVPSAAAKPPAPAANHVPPTPAPAKAPAPAAPPTKPAEAAKPPAPVAKGVSPPPSTPVAKAPAPSAPVAKGVAPPPPAAPVAKPAAPPSVVAKAPAPAPVAKGVAPPPEPAAKTMPSVAPSSAVAEAPPDGNDVKKPAKPVKASKQPGANGPPVNEEDLVASMLAEEPKQEEEEGPPEGAPITFKCFFCDEQITVAAELAGKQAPCPECRRIVKVPLPVKVEPKDWRKVDRRVPAGARQDAEPEPEGAWGTATQMTKVSARALLDAEAIPIEKEPLTFKQRMNWWVPRGILVGVVVLIAWGAYAAWRQRNQMNALQAAIKYADDPKKNEHLGAAEAALMHRDLGEFYVRTDDQYKIDLAQTQFTSAQRRLAAVRNPLERDLYLIDLALAQIDLGGNADQRLRKIRLHWTPVQTDVQRTMQALTLPEARAEAIRLVTRKLLDKSREITDKDEPKDERKLNAPARANAITQVLGKSDPELLAVLGLELLGVDDKREQANRLADDALKLYQTEKKPPVAPSLLALLGAVDPSGKKANELLPAAANSVEARIGYAMGFAYLGEWEKAIQRAVGPNDSDPSHQLQALLAVAASAAEQKRSEASTILGDLAREPKVAGIATPWQLVQIIRLAGHPNVKSAALTDGVTKMVANIVADPKAPADIKARLETELVRLTLAGSKQAETERLKSEAEKAAAAHPQALEMLARHNARYGSASAVKKAIDAWTPESLRPAGYAGVALGLQDAELGRTQTAGR